MSATDVITGTQWLSIFTGMLFSMCNSLKLREGRPILIVRVYLARALLKISQSIPCVETVQWTIRLSSIHSVNLQWREGRLQENWYNIASLTKATEKVKPVEKNAGLTRVASRPQEYTNRLTFVWLSYYMGTLSVLLGFSICTLFQSRHILEAEYSRFRVLKYLVRP